MPADGGHTYDLRPLPRLGLAVRGWGNPYTWEPTKRDGRACGINQGVAGEKANVGHGHLVETVHNWLEMADAI